jgi:hypothetical protein
MADNSLLAIERWFESAPPKLLSAATGPVVSNAQVVGPLANQALQEGQEMTQEEFDEQLRLFKKSPANGISTILELARKRSGFDASKLNEPAQKQNFERYLTDVQAAPFFTLVLAQKTTLHRESQDYNELIDAISKTFEGLATEDQKSVTEGITNLAKTAASSEHFKQTEDLFVQSVLHAQNNNWSIYLYRSSVTLTADKEKGATTRQSDFLLQKLKLKLLHEQWPFWAEKVLRKTGVAPIQDWLDGNSTPMGNLAFNLCIGKSTPA